MKNTSKNSKEKSAYHYFHWLFLAGFIVFLAIGLYNLRQNNLQALKLRDAVLTSDKNNGSTEEDLRNLRIYVYSHMNTNLASGHNAIRPPIQLKYRYQRLVDAQNAQVQAKNAVVMDMAKKSCQVLVGTDVHDGRSACINNYMVLHGAKAQPIPDSLYKFDFISPLWSTDAAGWSLLLATLFLVLFISGFAMEKWLRSNMRSQQ